MCCQGENHKWRAGKEMVADFHEDSTSASVRFTKCDLEHLIPSFYNHSWECHLYGHWLAASKHREFYCLITEKRQLNDKINFYDLRKQMPNMNI